MSWPWNPPALAPARSRAPPARSRAPPARSRAGDATDERAEWDDAIPRMMLLCAPAPPPRALGTVSHMRRHLDVGPTATPQAQLWESAQSNFDRRRRHARPAPY